MKTQLASSARLLAPLALTLAILGAPAPAHALLINLGMGMIYDDATNLTWLEDADYMETSGYGPRAVTWTEALAWADGLVYGGYDDWRLPAALEPNGTGPDLGYDVTTNELGALYYGALGNAAASATVNVGPFRNVQGGWTEMAYWTSTPDGSLGVVSFHFDNMTAPLNGLTDEHFNAPPGTGGAFENGFAWAVRSGRAVVPEPGTLLLFGAGLVAAMIPRRPRR